MSIIHIHVHVVFTTKNKQPFLSNSELRRRVFQHIKRYADRNGIWLDSVSGYSDHCHFLLSLKSEQCIADVVKRIKGESAFWINQNGLTDSHFGWQSGYWAKSVCPEAFLRTRRYIHSQEKRHSSDYNLSSSLFCSCF